MTPVPVSVENFARAETDRMFAAIAREAGGLNAFGHNRTPTPIDSQTVIRMNRDTLYSFAIVDVSAGASVTIPDAGGRYLSLMAVNEDHYVSCVLHEPGEHSLSMRELGTPFVALAARILVDPNDPVDVAEVASLQDRLGVAAGAAGPFAPPEYDAASLDATRAALLELGRGLSRFDRAFGPRDQVDPVTHLIGTAAGWGGLPESEARYIPVEPRLPVGEYSLTVADVPVDGFWSISVYNRDGFFEPNALDAYSVNSITAAPEEDGSVTVNFGGCERGLPNCLPIVEGWNYTVRLYRPRREALDGSWTLPELVVAGA
jgi:hypothetical protein